MFIARAKEIHGDKYDYSKVDYQDMHSKVLVICPRHSEFYQRAQSHLLGCGCPKCKYDKHIARIKRMMERQIDQKQTFDDESGIITTKLP